MKKYILSLVALAAISSVADAEQVSATRAREIAATVLPGATFTQPSRIRGVSDGHITATTPYYVFNARGTAGGYVIVAGDDRLPAVLGYSTDGTLDLDDAPDALLALLQMSADAIETVQPTAYISTGTPVVEPLLGEINWGQDAPFNTMCPLLSSQKNGYVGCVATAMSQIMRYYSYPETGTGANSYVDGGKTLSADFGATTYDWANMPAAVPDMPTQANVDAYSTLCYHLGVAVNMQYATGGSGAYTQMVAPALRDYFRYSPRIRMHSRAYYDTDDWMGMIRTELDAGRPVYYGATSEDGITGHAFVCDGYDTEGYVHINWGWYGRSNGYFYINHLNPGELGEGGGSGAYNLSQEILTNFTPEGDGYDPTIYGATRMSCDAFGQEMTMMTYVENQDTRAFDGTLLAILTDVDETAIIATLSSQPLKVQGFKNGRIGTELVTMRNVPMKTDAPDGTYHVKFGYMCDGMPSAAIMRHTIGLPAYAECTVTNGTVTLGDKHVPAPDVLMTTPLAPDGEIYANGSARFTVNLLNRADDFRLSSLVLKFENVDDPAITASATFNVNIYDLSADDVTMDIDLPAELPVGDYRVTLYHTDYPDHPFETCDGQETIVTISPEATSPVLRFTAAPDPYNAADGSDSYRRGDMIYGSFALKNSGAAGTTQFIMRATSVDNPEHPTVIRAVSKTWAKGEKATVTLANTLALDPGEYLCTFSSLDADGNEIAIDSPGITITMTECTNPSIEVTDLQLPSALLNGERYTYSVTVKALHDIQGTFYLRLRQYTYTAGELVTMTSINLKAGETKVISGNYRCTLDDGLYLTMAEFKEGNTTAPASGHTVYYREVTVGDTSAGIDSVVNDSDTTSNLPVEWYNLNGMRISEPTVPGLYIRRQGTKAEKIIIR